MLSIDPKLIKKVDAIGTRIQQAACAYEAAVADLAIVLRQEVETAAGLLEGYDIDHPVGLFEWLAMRLDERARNAQEGARRATEQAEDGRGQAIQFRRLPNLRMVLQVDREIWPDLVSEHVEIEIPMQPEQGGVWRPKIKGYGSRLPQAQIQILIRSVLALLTWYDARPDLEFFLALWQSRRTEDVVEERVDLNLDCNLDLN